MLIKILIMLIKILIKITRTLISTVLIKVLVKMLVVMLLVRACAPITIAHFRFATPARTCWYARTFSNRDTIGLDRGLVVDACVVRRN